jgi:hypothetical protein
VDLLERDGGLSSVHDCLKLEFELVGRRLRVDFTERVAGTVEVASKNGEAGSFGKEPVHADELEDGERKGEGENDAPAVVDVFETS